MNSEKGVDDTMKKLYMNSPEVNRINKNMALENIYLSEDLQKRAIALVNAGEPITAERIIKEIEYAKKGGTNNPEV